MRLIDADKVLDKMQNTFDMQELYLPIHFKELITDDMETVEAIPREKIDEMVAEIEDKICSFNYFASEMVTRNAILKIIHKYCDKENKND